MTSKKQLLLIDGHAMIFRAYHAMERQGLTNSSGIPVGAIFGFYRMLAKLLIQRIPDYFLLIFDPPGDNFRHRLYPEYKANRTEAPDELKNQMQEILSIAEAIQAPVLVPQDVEADDAIAVFVEKHKNSAIDITIVSGDKDLYSLLYDNVQMLRATKGVSEFKNINANFVQEDLNIHFSQMVDFLAITGDSSDNLPGVRGVGPKGASKLLNQYQTLENIYKNIDEIKPDGTKNKLIESKENAFLSQTLARLKTELLLDTSLEKLDTRSFIKNHASKFEIFKEKELNVVYQDWLSLAGKNSIKQKEVGEHFSVIQSIDEWHLTQAEIKKEELCAIDTETTHTSPMKAKLLGVAISWKTKLSGKEIYKSVYIPCIFENLSRKETSTGDLFTHTDEVHSDYQEELHGKKNLTWLREFLESSDIKKVGQNIKYDWLVLRCHGVNLRGVTSDTMLMSFLLKPNMRRHNLDDMAFDYIDHNTIKYSDLVGTGKEQKILLSVPLQRVAEYACEDTEVTLRLHYLLKAHIEKENLSTIYQTIDLPLIYVIMIIEKHGVVLDTDYLQKLCEKYKQKIDQIKEKIFEITGETFNIRSTQALSRILFEKLGIVSEQKTEKGKLSTNHKVLERLKHEHPVIPYLLEFRLLSKLLSTYIVPLPQAILESTNRVHTSFSQVIAATARLSSMEPNLQNIPIKGEEGRAIRQAFIAEEGCELLSLDYSQIELRILAHYSEDENLLRAYSNGEDIHDQATYLLFNQYFDGDKKTWNLPIHFSQYQKNENNSQSQVSTQTSDENQEVKLMMSKFDSKRLDLMKTTDEFHDFRSRAKILNFSIIYGVTDWGLSQQLNIPRSEAKRLIEAYFINYPNIKKYMNHIIQQSREKGYVENLLGRKRMIHDLDHQNRFKREAAERLAMNTPIQSTAADIIKIAMIDIQKKIEIKGLKTKMILQIHDELLFEVPVHEKQEIFEIAQHTMENAVQLKVPLKVSGGFGKNWNETK